MRLKYMKTKCQGYWKITTQLNIQQNFGVLYQEWFAFIQQLNFYGKNFKLLTQGFGEFLKKNDLKYINKSKAKLETVLEA